ncbi:MAG: hypothetical protein FD141_543 [Fusobacteria bacterium]|nr:MAG: hypothetical protein FD141_543 [Fusobacteriota bacterium]KAF0228792.1 MAG: hypothetical protein FD182_1048 [Fusobacteriota bacterium]
MKLQSNEKRLLLILAVVSIIALSFQYLILPEFKKGQELSDRNKSLSLAYNLIVNKDGKASDIEKEYNQANRMLERILEKDLSGYLGYEEIDLYFTRMALSHGLKPTSLVIENPKDINKDAKEYNTIKEVYVTLEVSGSMDQLFSLMKEIDGKGFLKVEYLDSVNNNETYNHNIKVSILMLKG